MKNRSTNIKNSGFTLIEMIVTVAIVAIFASIALPSFSQLIKNNRISTTTNEFISALVLARSEALKRSRDVTVCTSTDLENCSASQTDFSKGWIVLADTDNPAVKDVIKVNDGFDNVYIGVLNADGTSAGNKSLSYKFSGRTDSAVTFKVGHAIDDVVKEVVVNRIGRIRSQ